MSEKNEWKLVPVIATDEMETAAEDDYEQTGATFPRWKSAYAAMIAAAPASAQPERDWEISCDHCNGSGYVFVERQVAERKSDVQEFKEECECCEGRGFTIAFEDIPGIAKYVKSCRAPSAPGDAQDERQAFEAWFERRGVWPRLSYEEVFIAGWKAHHAPAAGDALDAARWRKVVAQWRIQRVEVFDGVTLSHTRGIKWDDLTRQVDAALAAQVPQQGEA